MKFYKLHGAGNDFIFIAGRNKIPRDAVIKLCDRHTGIGADGLIRIHRSSGPSDFHMEYFNSDGSPADFCANGGRCAVLLAKELGYFSGTNCEFAAGDGAHKARIAGEGVIELQMKMPAAYLSGIKFKGVPGEYCFTDTGVGHAVGFFDDISDFDVAGAGRIIRSNPLFLNGTNVNFVQRLSENVLKVRTYERGVEAETGACGTGITASAWTDMALRGGNSRKVISFSGYELAVSKKKGGLFLTGPAEIVFSGHTADPVL